MLTRGPVHAPSGLVLHPFRFHDSVSGKWARARYVAERHEIAERYREWDVGAPEIPTGVGAAFSPWK